MKKKGCTAYLIEDRNDSLLKAYNRIIKKNGCHLSVQKVYSLLQEAPSPRFWITGERAYKAILMRKLKQKKSYSQRAAMYDEIFKRACEYSKANGISFRKACRRVVLTPAPSFYLDSGTMENIIRTMLKKKRRQRREDNGESHCGMDGYGEHPDVHDGSPHTER